ncbi:MAG TPA: hypothetical protein VML54_04605 [Candidatus Limnocylindrales bacterium]|nr:hypothetical protein [Candidatus Limnocylindrales bacterium]
MPFGPLQLPPGGRHWFVKTLAVHGVEASRAVLGGFSQGAVMAYSVGLAPGRPSPAAIIAFSGYIPRVEGFDLALEGRAGVPVSVSHGSLDPTVAAAFEREARVRLERAGLAVRYREDPSGHEITPGAPAQARAVIAEALA